MTPSATTPFKAGEKYNMLVLGAHQDNVQSYVNVEDDKTGQSFKVEVKGVLKNKLFMLQGQHVSVVCTGLTGKGPEFVLGVEYFEQPVETHRRGANLRLEKGPALVFQRSFFLNSITNQPDDDQPFAIAKQIAAFMNTEGGDLYLGVDDEGFVVGVESDYPLIGKVSIMMDADEDREHLYSPDLDSYRRKITNALITYLSQDSASLLPAIETLRDEEAGLTYLWIHAEPSPDIVYLGREEEVYIQSGTEIEPLRGRKRDMYVRNRFFLRGEQSAAEALEQYRKEYEAAKTELEKTKDRLKEALSAKGRETVADPQKPEVMLGAKTVSDPTSPSLSSSYISILVERGWKKDSAAVRQLEMLCAERALLHEDSQLLQKPLKLRIMEVLQHNGIDPDKYYKKSTKIDLEHLPKYANGGPIYDRTKKWWEYRK